MCLTSMFFYPCNVTDCGGTQQNETESLRLKTRDYELLAGQSGAYTLIVLQQLQAQQQHLQSAALSSTAGGGIAQASHSGEAKDAK